ncbi:indoleacetamide hydrolase [Aquincola tertiaricarbonis]|uniref:indoleacetamide hydrolase n=1 Tax=Aquincola tertiaricarbonis TaxID=391953 RepID=UPI0009FB5DB4|nr:indoleacetamide hydrolase [Aquincola tertiaricarbonis]
MPAATDRRHFLQTTGALGALGATGAAGLLAACGGDDGRYSAAEQRGFSVAETVSAIAQGRLDAQALVSTLLARARALSSLNSLITLDEAGALAAARELDERRRSGATLPPLAGLPIVVKDNINVRGLPTTAGTPALRHVVAAADAPSVQRLRDAGAIVLGKANLHELAFGITSTNLSPFAGPVHNPYDTTRIPGGSSGGTAAAIAARIVVAGLGTDTGGSTRVPAALCGIAGLRPSVGNGGAERRYHDENAVVPISHTRDTVGPLGRTVADLAWLDAAITGTAVPAPAALAGLRLGIPAGFWSGLDASLAPVVQAARDRLQAAGVVLVEVDLPGLSALNDQVSFQIALHEPIADLPAWLAANGAGQITLADVAAGVASPDVKGAFSAILADAFGAAYADAINVHRPRLQALYAACFADNRIEALLFPTTVLPATTIDAVNGSSTVSIHGGPPADTFGTYIRNTDPGSNAGLPGLSLPAGLTAAGLPVGLELDGPVGSDRRLIAIGMAIEALLGPLPAPPI